MMPCPKCSGEGQVPVTETLTSVLDLLKKQPRLSAAEVQLKLGGATVNAYNNRLEHLRWLRMVTRERVGHAWRYSAVKH